MARSYNRRRGRRASGLLVREAAVQKGVSSNSLFSMPFGSKTAPSSTGIGTIVEFDGSINGGNKLNVGNKTNVWTGSTTGWSNGGTRLVRYSSITVASKSPFKVKVFNAGGGFTVYQVPGQKPTKITLGENSMLGNPSLMYMLARQVNTSQQTYSLIGFNDAEDEVDWQLNAVCDSGFDDDLVA